MPHRDFKVSRGKRPYTLFNMEPVGYKNFARGYYREFYRDRNGNYYSWVFEEGDKFDVGTVYGPLKSV